MKKIKAIVYSTAIVCLGACSSSYEEDRRALEISTSLNETIKLSMQQDLLVMQARYALTNDYDELNKVSKALEESIEGIQASFDRKMPQLAKKLKVIQHKLKTKNNHIEYFKSYNAVARNASQYAPHVLDELLVETYETDMKAYHAAYDLRRALVGYALHPLSDNKMKLGDALRQAESVTMDDDMLSIRFMEAKMHGKSLYDQLEKADHYMEKVNMITIAQEVMLLNKKLTMQSAAFTQDAPVTRVASLELK